MEFAAHDLGEAGAALADALIFAPADQAELLAHIHRYDPNYELTGTAAQLDRHGIRALGEALLQAQRDYLGANSFECGSDYDHQLYTDAQWAVGQNDGFTILSQDTIREQFERFHREYQANGGTLSFDDWVSEGMPQDDELLSSTPNEGESNSQDKGDITRTEEEYDDLARDPAHNGATTSKTEREREVGLGWD